MNGNTAWLLTISIRESAAGMFFATSEDEPTFFVSANSAATLYKAIPMALREMFRDRDNVDVRVVPLRGKLGDKEWAVLPMDVITQASAAAA